MLKALGMHLCRPVQLCLLATPVTQETRAWYLSKMQMSGGACSRIAVSCCSLFGGQTEVLHPASSSRRVCSLGAEELQGNFQVSRLPAA